MYHYIIITLIFLFAACSSHRRVTEQTSQTDVVASQSATQFAQADSLFESVAFVSAADTSWFRFSVTYVPDSSGTPVISSKTIEGGRSSSRADSRANILATHWADSTAQSSADSSHIASSSSSASTAASHPPSSMLAIVAFIILALGIFFFAKK
jgi:hypothetical protein